MKSLFVVVLMIISAISLQIHAKDLTSRLGIGYADQFGIDGGLPSVAIRYYPNANLGVAGQIGIDTKEDYAKFGAMAKVFRVIFMEDNMNFYMGGGAGMISRELPGEGNESGFELAGFFGGEFFLPGLESLGFNFEAGVGVTSISSEVRFRTIGDSPLKAGMSFYF